MASKKARKTIKKTQSTKPAKPTAQKELIVVMAISLLLGLGGGYALGLIQDDSSSLSVADTTQKTTHSHEAFEVSAATAPKVELVVTEDAKSGYNVKVVATDFTFTPESVNADTVAGEGHAHLYVDGVKIGRLYSPYYHYSGSFEGTKIFRVTLNANDHSEYTVDGEVIAAEVRVAHNSLDPDHNDAHMTDVIKDEGEDHSHSDM